VGCSLLKLKLGEIDVNITLSGPGASTIETVLKSLINSKTNTVPEITIEADVPSALGEPESEDSRTIEIPNKLARTAPLTPLTGLSLLKSMDFTNFTIVMVAKKVLGINGATQTNLEDHFTVIKEATFEWENRSLEDENIWAIYIAQIAPPKLGKRVFAVGLNKQNQQVILGWSDKDDQALYHNLKSRGLNLKSIKFGMLSFFFSGDKRFRKTFPNAALARDWNEFIDLHEQQEEQEEIKALMLNPSKKEVEAGLKDFEGPKELLTYFDFDSELWRALRTLSNINKIDNELRSYTNKLQESGVAAKSPESAKFVVLWALLRIQYQWFKIPVNAKYLGSLKYMAPTLQAIKS
jgi:hypothetical protein